VRGATRDEDETAISHSDFAITQQKRRVTLRDVEGLVGVRV
jgi:hypothetical protein